MPCTDCEDCDEEVTVTCDDDLTVVVDCDDITIITSCAQGPAGAEGPEGPPGAGVESVVAGTNVTVDNTDPANPIVSATGGGGVLPDTPMRFLLTDSAGDPTDTPWEHHEEVIVVPIAGDPEVLVKTLSTIDQTQAQFGSIVLPPELGGGEFFGLIAEDLIGTTPVAFFISDKDTLYNALTAGWMDGQNFSFNITRPDLSRVIQIDTNGMKLNTGSATVDFIETNLTDDDTHLPTSGAVYGAIAGAAGADWGDIGGTLSDQTDLQTALDGKVDENAAITGATKTKITYDAKGLVTAGADATTADIADSTNKRYVTDANLTVIGNTSGVNTGDQNLSGYLQTANNLSEINTADNRASTRYNIRTNTLTAVTVYVSNVSSLSGAATANDGVTPATGDVVLLVGQSTASQNGVWKVDTGGAWTRPPDFPSGGAVGSLICLVGRGSVFANSVWGLAAPATITIDTTAQVWRLQSKPSGVFPNILPTSGDYYSLGGQAAATTPGLASAGKIVAHPIWLDVGTLDRIAVSSSVAAVSTWRLGLYKANPFTTLCDGEVPFLDAGTVNMNATAGLQAITISQAITEPGIYWAAVLVDAYTAQPTTHNVVYSSSSGIGWSGLPQDMSSFGRFRVGRTYVGVALPTGSLPTFPTTSMSWAGLLPRIAVRYA